MVSTRIPKSHPVMRKEPRQARSRATVDAIVQAGARILGDHGWAGFTTNKVAEKAGVSIGSLYQYFPDKLSLIEAVRSHHFEDVLRVIRRAMDGPKPIRQFAETLVDGMIAAHLEHPALHRVMLDEVPGQMGSRLAHDAFRAEYLGRYAAAIAPYRRIAKRRLIAEVLSAAVEGVIHNAARNGQLKAPELRRELVSLICAYLSQSGRKLA
jgi:AcrR family transcriptional regulator